MIRALVLNGTIAALLSTAMPAHAQQSSAHSPELQSLDDAWWTGPMLAPSAATLPRGHFLIEPYLFDTVVTGRYDTDAVRRTRKPLHTFGTLTYVLYGLADRLTIGLIPLAGYNRPSDGPSSSGIGLGDLTLHAQFGLTKFSADRGVPSTSLVVEQTLPTGKHDRLGTRPSDGFGSGAYTTSIAFYSQTYLWLPNGRILRMRGNVSYARSTEADVNDVSVYGTRSGFRGRAAPGDILFLNGSCEYSVTRRWVLALDATYRRDGNTRVTGVVVSDRVTEAPVRLDSGGSDAFGLAPAVEYSWSSRVGVLMGIRLIPAGRNTSASITPAVAINIVR